MNREALDKFFERGILVLVMSILVFAPLAMGAVEPWAFLVVQALTICVLLFWALRLWFSPKPQLFWPPICWVVLAFALYAIARYLTADIEYVARLELIQVLVCAFLFFAVLNNLYRQELSQVISFTMIFLAMGVSAYAVFQFLTHSPYVWKVISPYPGRASGTYISPNDLAGFLEMLLPLALAYVLTGRMKITTRIFLAYATLVIVAGVIVSFSRGGWVAAVIGVVALLAVLLGSRQTRLPAALALAFILIAGGFFVEHYLSKSITYIERADETFKDGKVVLDYRRDMWRVAEQMWLGHFWFGVGPAHYNYVFREYRPPRMQAQPDRAHNDYLNLLADWGTVGGIIVLAGMTAFAAGLWQTRKHVRRAENTLQGSGASNRQAFFLGATAGLLALAAHSFVDFNLHIPANAILGVTLLALLTGNLRFATEGYWRNMRTPMKISTTLVLVAGISWLGWQEWRRANETFWNARAQNSRLVILDRAALLEKAFNAEPGNPNTAYTIGEFYRIQSFTGDTDYEQQAGKAMDWYARAIKLNPHDGYSYLRTGMCLDWVGRFPESGKYYAAAEALDPNGYYTVANIGWHYVQTGDYPAAWEWLQRSLELNWERENRIAGSYSEIIRQKMIENASGKSQLPPGF
ncbi:MAG TPA: O-antigen ligase family protein [Verrucomicrobiae bacterium]|jgi:O-antigen ligase